MVSIFAAVTLGTEKDDGIIYGEKLYVKEICNDEIDNDQDGILD